MPKRSIIRIASLISCIFVMNFVQAQQKSLTIGLIGDSTVANTYGWGPAFAIEVNDQVKVLNYAKNGATLDSLSKKLDALIKKKPNYIIIQFGHNDMKRYDTKSYSEKLKGYVERIKRAGIKAIIFSSVTRRNFGEDRKISPREINGRTLTDYALTAKAVAKKAKVLFIDLHSISIEHHNKIGPKATETYNFNETDSTHFSKEGAKATANLIIMTLKATSPELVKYFK